MSLQTLTAGFSGINNKLNPARLKYNKETGISELSEAVNCDIDDSGMISRRAGQTELSSLPSHSIYRNEGDCFVVQDYASESAIAKINNDFSLTGVRAGLVKGARVSFWQQGHETYYMNGSEYGVIEDGVSYGWPGDEHVGVETDRVFFPVPLGYLIAIFNNRMCVAVEEDGENVIYLSEVYAYGKFRKAKMYWPFGTPLKMMMPVLNGMWVSDSESTGFIESQESFESMRYVPKSPFPAHGGSVAHSLVDLSKTYLQIPGLSAVWSSDEGLCVGTQDGEIVNVTDQKLFYPTGDSGATVIDGNIVINSVY